MKSRGILAGLALGLSFDLTSPSVATAQTAPCVFRGELDTPFCDLNRDWLADRPLDRTRWRNPAAISFSYLATVESEAAALTFRPFLDHLTRCLSKRVLFAQMPSTGAQVEAMRGGRLHVAALPVVWIPVAVTFGGAIPFATAASVDGIDVVKFQILARHDAPTEDLPDLRGKRLAIPARGLSLADLVARAAYGGEGLELGRDYRPVIAGSDERGLSGVVGRLYDAVVIGDDSLADLVARRRAVPADFKLIWESRAIPKIVFVHSHDLVPELQEKLQICFRSFVLPDNMLGVMGRNDRFFSLSYGKELDPIRTLGERAGQAFNRALYDAERRRDTEIRAGPRP